MILACRFVDFLSFLLTSGQLSIFLGFWWAGGCRYGHLWPFLHDWVFVGWYGQVWSCRLVELGAGDCRFRHLLTYLHEWGWGVVLWACKPVHFWPDLHVCGFGGWQGVVWDCGWVDFGKCKLRQMLTYLHMWGWWVVLWACKPVHFWADLHGWGWWVVLWVCKPVHFWPDLRFLEFVGR